MGTMPNTATTLYRFLLDPLTRYVLAWLVFLSAGTIVGAIAWGAMDMPSRKDGNCAHALIDFGGQWVLGRMLWLGLGDRLYHRNDQRQVVSQAYPREDEAPDEERIPEERGEHDADNLMRWFMGHEDPDQAPAIGSFLAPLAAQDLVATLAFVAAQEEAKGERWEKATAVCIGGPLYPPIHAVAMAPLGYFRPQTAYRIVQLLSTLTALLAGWGICLLSRRRVWWPVASTAIVLFPAFSHNLNLGQNGVFTLTLLILGWALIARGWPIGGGMVWGLLAFKPVWAAAFFLVPLWTGRWRVCLTMIATGACLALATLPLVGWHTWIDWLQVGRYATSLYQTDENWIFLSRDLITVPRRWLLDFKSRPSEATNLAAMLFGSVLVLAAVECTTRVAMFRKDRSRVITGPAAAFLLLGAWLGCFHFMYIDVILTALPVTLLLVNPRQFLQPRFLSMAEIAPDRLPNQFGKYFGVGLANDYPSASFHPRLGLRSVYILNSMTLTLIALLVLCVFVFAQVPVAVSVSLPVSADGPIPMPLRYSTSTIGTPLDTFCLGALWLWCGWLWMWTPRPRALGASSPVTPAV